MAVILIIEQDQRNIHWTHHYLQSRENYPQSVTYERSILGGNPQSNTVRVEPQEKLYIGAGCTGSSYSDLCGDTIQTTIISVSQIRSSNARSEDNEDNYAAEYGIGFVPQRATAELVK